MICTALRGARDRHRRMAKVLVAVLLVLGAGCAVTDNGAPEVEASPEVEARPDVETRPVPPEGEPEAEPVVTAVPESTTTATTVAPPPPTYEQRVRAADPVAYWRFEELHTQIVRDDGGLPALLGADVVAGAGGAPLVGGSRGVVLPPSPDGTVEVALGDLPPLPGPVTVELWARSDGDGGLAIEVAGLQLRTPPAALAGHRFRHVAVTTAAGVDSWYLDGELVTTEASPARRTDGGPLVVAATGPARLAVDEVALYDRTLTADEVRAHHGASTETDTAMAASHHLAYDAAAPPEAGANRFVVLNPWELDRLRELRASDPGVRVLLYKNLGFVRDDLHEASGRSSSGVSWPEASAHPEWFLLDADGGPITSSSFPSLHAADLADPEYQRAWAEGTLAEIEVDGWDGVFLDDVNTTMAFHHPAEDVADYPSDATYQLAVESALAAITPTIRSRGHLAVANIGAPQRHPEVWGRWLGYLDGAMDEQFVKHGDGDPDLDTYSWRWGDTDDWSTRVAFVIEAERQGRWYLGMTHSTADDERAARYGLATLLLGSEGRSSFAHVDGTGREVQVADRDVAVRMGLPSGSAVDLASGLVRREFVRGVVVVNPTAANATIELAVAHTGGGEVAATSFTLEPKSALLLEPAS